MIFLGTPNKAVIGVTMNGFDRVIKPLFRFDKNGEYETNDPKMIKRCQKQFEVKEETKPRKCKKCNFTCETQGELLRHYRENHPKEG